MTRRYLLSIMLLTLALVVASFLVMAFWPARFHVFMPVLAIYFTLVTGLQHYWVVRAAHKDPRTFIKVFLGLAVGSLFLHLTVLTAYLFTHMHEASTIKPFLVSFCIGYIVFLAFETTALVLFVKGKQQ